MFPSSTAIFQGFTHIFNTLRPHRCSFEISTFCSDHSSVAKLDMQHEGHDAGEYIGRHQVCFILQKVGYAGKNIRG